MEALTEVKKNRKEEKANLRVAIATLRKCMTDYKALRTSEWKSFKGKFNADMGELEKSIKKLKKNQKK